jgi:hypothetical protein
VARRPRGGNARRLCGAVRADHALQILRRQNLPAGPLIGAHFVRVIVLYSMYEACQIAWGLWLYDKPMPEGLELEVYASSAAACLFVCVCRVTHRCMDRYAIIMIWEYFSMIYLRSATAIYYLPKFALVYFCWFHFYFYGTSYVSLAHEEDPRAARLSLPSLDRYGFYGVALLAMTGFTVHSLVFAVNHFEVPASERLEVSPDKPRAFFTELPWPAWDASLPPSWTLFMPLNSRQRNIYEVPSVPWLFRRLTTCVSSKGPWQHCGWHGSSPRAPEPAAPHATQPPGAPRGRQRRRRASVDE